MYRDGQGYGRYEPLQCIGERACKSHSELLTCYICLQDKYLLGRVKVPREDLNTQNQYNKIVSINVIKISP